MKSNEIAHNLGYISGIAQAIKYNGVDLKLASKLWEGGRCY